MFKYKAIAKKREKLGMSQSQLSKISGIRVENISRLENGKQMNPTLITLENLARSLQMKISDLVDESQPTV